jgi:hypothetical protein
MSEQTPEPAVPEPDTSPPEEEGEKYDGGEIPAAAPEEDPES